jgi:hypothetical protein
VPAGVQILLLAFSKLYITWSLRITMPIINIDYDNNCVKDNEAILVSDVIRDIVSRATKIEDVPVYTNSAHIKVEIAPIEILIRMSANKIDSKENLIKMIKEELKEWKKKNKFKHKINLTLIPMDWKIEIGI